MIKEVIVVEGKSDTAKLKSLFDCDTIETHGSAIDDDVLALIKEASQKRGVIIFTDPDYPGMQIRNKISEAIPECKHAFVHKKDAIAHHKVGIAEATPEAIKEALEKACVFKEDEPTLSRQAFIRSGIMQNKALRLKVYDYFHLGYGNVKTLYKRLNMIQVDDDMLERCIEDLNNETNRDN